MALPGAVVLAADDRFAWTEFVLGDVAGHLGLGFIDLAFDGKAVGETVK